MGSVSIEVVFQPQGSRTVSSSAFFAPASKGNRSGTSSCAAVWVLGSRVHGSGDDTTRSGDLLFG